jgi:serine/threonine protein kinase
VSPQRWREIEDLYTSASAKPREERDSFLKQACPDAELRSEVLSLLANGDTPSAFVDRPAWEAQELSLLPSGSVLGPYEIVRRIATGGMGEVYEARDTRLQRTVAIKTGHEKFSARFEREARAIAALNHPHICQIYDVGPNYLVMEYVEGTDLKGPVALDRALEVAGQVAAALEAAHERGIVHRDLKPGNIKIKPDGSLKVLDFGLAKSAATTEVMPDSPGILSLSGMILGTAGYMSPEQAHGGEVDKRADIFAFGVVLYELVAGERLFAGATVSDTITAVLTREPDYAKAPPEVRRLLRRCLEKDPRKRLRDIGDWQELLDTEVSPVLSPSRVGIAWIVAGALALGLTAVSFLYLRQRSAELPVVRSTILFPENAALSSYQNTALFALSPDGRRIVFAARTHEGKNQLWVRPLDSNSARLLAGTEGASLPFWSPDGRSIGFFAGGKLNRIDAAGGPAVVLADALYRRGASWSADGTILFAPNNFGQLRKVPAAGGAASDATRLGPGENSHRWPWFLPDGRHFLLVVGIGVGPKTIRLGSIDSLDSTKLLEADSNAVYSAGYLLFLRGDTLMAQPFDLRSLRLSGEALPAVERVRSGGYLGAFSASANGLLAYMSRTAEFDLDWFDRKGNHTGSLGDPASFDQELNFSPDRRQLAVGVSNRLSSNIWLYDIARGAPTRFTFDPAYDYNPIWSPDGKTIVFASNRRGHPDLFRKAANGSGAEELLYADELEKYPLDISRNGKSLLYWTPGDLWILPDPLGPPEAAKPYLLLQTQFDLIHAQFSPDGHWIAYVSDESGRAEIYVAPFPGPGSKRQISTAGGTQPRWRSNGKEIFYVASDQRLTETEVSIKGGEIEADERIRCSVRWRLPGAMYTTFRQTASASSPLGRAGTIPRP